MSCLIDITYGECPEFFSVKVVKARKSHKCCECNRVINIGEKYERANGKWLGKVDTYATCLDCVSVKKSYFCNYNFRELWDAFAEEIKHMIGDKENAFFSKLEEVTPLARDRIFDLIRKNIGEDF